MVNTIMVSLIHNLDDTKWVEVNSSDRGEGKTIQSRKKKIYIRFIFGCNALFNWLCSAKSCFMPGYDENDTLPQKKRNV